VSGEVLRRLIVSLGQASLHFEMLEIIEFFIQSPDDLLAPMMVAAQGNVLPEIVFRWAKILAEQGEHEECEKILSELRRDEDLLWRARCDIVSLRYCDVSTEVNDRVRRLKELSRNFLAEGNFDNTMWALECASELHCEQPITLASIQDGMEIHDALHSLCVLSGDKLSGLQFELRRCDILCSLTTNLAAARDRRDILLKDPLCKNLPFFERFHKRQWAEYFMIHQYEPALEHAKAYFDYCQRYRDEGNASLAENMVLQTMAAPKRASDELRISQLEDIAKQLEHGIDLDKANQRSLSQIQKIVLLVEVSDELGTLQDQERQDTWADVVGLLNEADRLCSQIAFSPDIMFLAHNVAYLRSMFISETSAENDVSPTMSQGSANPTILKKGFFRKSFESSRLISDMNIAVQSDSEPMLRSVIESIEAESVRLKSEGHPLEQAEFFLVRGICISILVELSDFSDTDWSDFGIESRELGMMMVLESFDESLERELQFLREISSKDDKLDVLVALQAFLTSPLSLLLFEIAIRICYELGDDDQTWEWVQRSKARAFSASLQATENIRAGLSVELLSMASRITVDDARWISKATSRNLVFVDWATIHLSEDGKQFIMLVLRFEKDSNAYRLKVVKLTTTVEEIVVRKSNLKVARLDSPDAGKFLSGFRSLLDPLEELIKEGDILVFSLTDALHNVPFHAVILAGKPLIETNPVVYIPSISTLRAMLRRLSAPEPGAESPSNWKAAILGAYDDSNISVKIELERDSTYQSLELLAKDLDTKPVLGKFLTRETFTNEVHDSNLVHFHGHAAYGQHSSLNQCLIMGDPKTPLTLPKVVSVGLKNAHVTLIACEGGVQDFSINGDEPLGLMSAFLLGGATSVIGALWPIQSSTGRVFTKAFYEHFLHEIDRSELGPVVNLAEALRAAVMVVRLDEERATPYHWAPFVLYGSWFCGRKPGTW
jgi:CHAT domain-containing protein